MPVSVLLRHVGASSNTREQRRHTVLLRIALAVLVLSLTIYVIFFAGFIDLHVYRAGAHALLNGIGLYSAEFPNPVPGLALKFTYPPFAALLFAPLQLLPWNLAKVAVTSVSALGLMATTLIVAGRCHGRRTIALVVGLGAAAAWFLFEPARSTIGFGQVNFVLMGLVAADCLLPRVRWPRGALIGVATAIKLTPAVFVLYFLVRRQYREAAVAFGSFLACSLVAFVIARGDTITYWTRTLLNPARIGGQEYAYNQCFTAILHRLMDEGWARTALWLLLATASMVLALIAARKARMAGDDVTALLAIAVGGLLASPISWSHHWVWIIPAAIALIRVAAASGPWLRAVLAVVGLLFVIGPHAYLPSTNGVEADWSWWQHLLGSSYVLAGLAALIVLALRPAGREWFPTSQRR